jgi:hypothetical protein
MIKWERIFTNQVTYSRATSNMPENQLSGDSTSQTGGGAVQRGGAGTEKTPADSGTPQNISGSLVCLDETIELCDASLGFAHLYRILQHRVPPALRIQA